MLKMWKEGSVCNDYFYAPREEDKEIIEKIIENGYEEEFDAYLVERYGDENGFVKEVAIDDALRDDWEEIVEYFGLDEEDEDDAYDEEDEEDEE